MKKFVISVLYAVGIAMAEPPQQSILPAADWSAGKYDVKVAVQPLLWPHGQPIDDHAVFRYLWDHEDWKAGLKPLEITKGSVFTLDTIWVNTSQAERLPPTYPRVSAPAGAQLSFSSSDPAVLVLQKDGSWKALKKGTAWVYGLITISFIPETRKGSGTPLPYHWVEAQPVVVK